MQKNIELFIELIMRLSYSDWIATLSFIFSVISGIISLKTKSMVDGIFKVDASGSAYVKGRHNVTYIQNNYGAMKEIAADLSKGHEEKVANRLQWEEL